MPKLNKIPPLQQAEMAKVHSSLMLVPIFMILSESDTSHRQLLTAVIWAKSMASKHRKSFNEIHFKSFICYKQKTSLSFAAKTLWLYHQWANTRPAETATATALDIPFRETRHWRGKAEGEGEQERELVAWSYRNLNRLSLGRVGWLWGPGNDGMCCGAFVFAARSVWLRNLIGSVDQVDYEGYISRYTMLSLCKDIFNIPRLSHKLW